MTTQLIKRSSAGGKYHIDTFLLYADNTWEVTCTVNHKTGKVKVAAWSEYYGTFITKTIVGGDPEEFTIEDSLFVLRGRQTTSEQEKVQSDH